MHSASLLPTTASIITRNPNPKKPINIFYPNTTRKTTHSSNSNNNSVFTCKSSSSCSNSITGGLDLYDILGVDSSSDQSQIKVAYRTLQKRCHPDIAGPAGHDMAIILNQVYSLLSDPSARLAYDKEHAKISELRGYTGKPIYSVWLGSESEERAVFVDEVKCVGCLKCALLAERTFAVESIYGRARVVAQWADPENKIQEAIDACPVDCISVVERSNLAALEFLMSKQPRGNVRVGSGNAVGTRVSNIFVDVEKFQTRFQEATDKASSGRDTESDSQKEARNSAIQAIRSISNWLYWQSPNASQTREDLIRTGKKSTEPNIKKLKEAVAARKNAKPIVQITSNSVYNHTYWVPLTLGLPQATKEELSGSCATFESAPTKNSYKTKTEDFEARKEKEKNINPFVWGIPMAAATIAAVIVHLQVEEGTSGGLEDHIGGSLALGVVNSSWSPVILAGITWYLIGIYTVELLEALQRKLWTPKK